MHPWASLMLALIVLAAGGGVLFAQDSVPTQDWSQAQNDQPYAAAPYSSQALNASQLEQLVAPIALYPDALVAQILAASTYSPQVAEADRWRQAQSYATPEQIVADADMQSWDPSVKALSAFPQVLTMMGRNLQWTTDLGNAYYNQPQDVLEAVQVMRHRAEEAGSLRSSPQLVVRDNENTIELAPANPQVVYVPAYNPWAVYGEPVSPYPGFSLLGAIGEFFTPLRYGLGIAMSAFTHSPWGWLAWGLNWLTQAISFHSSDYYSHSATVADWGFPHRGFYAYGGRGSFARMNGFGRMHGGEGWRQRSEGWQHGGYNPGWRSFNRESGMHSQNWGHSGRAFDTFGGEHSSIGNRFRSSAFEGRSAYRSNPYSGARNNSGTYRAPVSHFQGSEFRSNRSSSNFSGRNVNGSYGKAQHSGGLHLFGASHSQKSFGGSHSSGMHFGGGGHAPKNFGGGGHFSGGHSHGGGGHSHGGGGGHSSGHGGGHHR